MESRRDARFQTVIAAAVIPSALMALATGCASQQTEYDTAGFPVSTVRPLEIPVAPEGLIASTAHTPSSTSSPAPSTPTSSRSNATEPTPISKTTMLDAALVLQGVPYSFGGGHRGIDAFEAGCSDPQKSVKLHKSLSQCAVDCSGLVDYAYAKVYGDDLRYSTTDFAKDTKRFKKISWKDARPNDLATLGTGNAYHIGIVVSTIASKPGYIKVLEAKRPGTVAGYNQYKFDEFWRIID